MKVLYLITKSNWGGAQRYVYDLATNARREGLGVAVVCGGNGALVDRLEGADVPVVRLHTLTRDVGLMREWRAFREILALLKRRRPDVLHINSSKAGLIGALAGRIAGVPLVIFTAHGWAFNEDRPWWQRLIIKKLHWVTVLLAHRTIAVSKAVKRQMNWPFARRKITVIYNGRAVPHMLAPQDARTRLALQARQLSSYMHDPWSVTIAELHPTKQHDVMIKAMREVVDEMPHVRHIIIGEGEDRTCLEARIKHFNLESNVFLLGNILEAARYLEAFSFMVLPSRTEALPYALIEAEMAALPSIASAVGGIPEIVRNMEEGILVAPGDVNGLAGAYLLLMRDEALRVRLSRAAHARSVKFSIAAMLEATFDLYAEV